MLYINFFRYFFLDKRKIFFILLAIMFFSIACATSMNEEGIDVKKIVNQIDGDTVVPRDANKIYIYSMSSTEYPDILKKLVVNINEILSIDGRLAVVDKREIADLELKIKITDYQLQKINFGKVGNPEKIRMRIVGAIGLLNIKKNRLILYENDIQAFKEFSEVIAPIENEEDVKIRVIKLLAQRISSKTITGWYSKYLTPIERKR